MEDDQLRMEAESDERDALMFDEADAREECDPLRSADDFGEDEEYELDEDDDGDSLSMELFENAQFEQADEWFGDYGCNDGDF